MCICLPVAGGTLLLPVLGWILAGLAVAVLFLCPIVVRVVAVALGLAFLGLYHLGCGLVALARFGLEVRADRKHRQVGQTDPPARELPARQVTQMCHLRPRELTARRPLAIEAPRPQLPASVLIYATPKTQLHRQEVS